MDGTIVFRHSKTVVAATVGDEVVLLDSERGTYFGLNAVAARTWELIGTEAPVAEIEAQLGREFDVESERLSADLQTLVTRLKDLRLIDPVEST